MKTIRNTHLGQKKWREEEKLDFFEGFLIFQFFFCVLKFSDDGKEKSFRIWKDFKVSHNLT